MRDSLLLRLLLAFCTRQTAWQLIQIAALVYSIYAFPWGAGRGFGIFAVIFAVWYYVTAAAATRIYMAGGGTEERILRRMPCLRGRGYYPTPYLINEHVQTLFAAMGRPLPRVDFNRQLNHDVFPDGETCIVDWAFGSDEDHALWEARNLKEGRASAAPILTTRASGEAHAARRSFRNASQYITAMRCRQKRPTAPFGSCGPHSKETVAAYDEDKRLRMRSGRAPVVILFHGLTGGNEDSNIYYLTKWLVAKGWHVAVPVRRGCADCPSYMSRPKHYAYGGLEDTEHAVNHVCDSMPGHPVLAVGLSAGSNVMINYMANHGRCSRIYGAVSVANGYCWEKGTAAIRDHHPVWDVIMSEIVHSTLYDRHRDVIAKAGAVSLSNGNATAAAAAPAAAAAGLESTPNTPTSGPALGPSVLPASPPGGAASPSYASGPGFPSEPQTTTARRPRSMREYDELVSKNLHGYSSLSEFYAEQSCVHRLHKLKHPAVFLNANDDPLASTYNVPYDALLRNPHTLLVCTPTGGHLGWATGWWPFRAAQTWMDSFVLEALDGLMVEALYRVDNPDVAEAKVRAGFDSYRSGNASSSAASSDDEEADVGYGL